MACAVLLRHLFGLCAAEVVGMSYDLLDNPIRNAATLHNLVHNFQAIGVSGWLEKVSFDQVVEAWWQAQERKAARLVCHRCKGHKTLYNTDGTVALCPRCQGSGMEPTN